MSADIRILRLPDVKRMTGLCRSMIYQKEADDPAFPKRIKLSPRTVGWVESEIQAWVASRISACRGVSAGTSS